MTGGNCNCTLPIGTVYFVGVLMVFEGRVTGMLP